MVYVDNIVKYPMAHNSSLGNRLGHYWCHLWADSLEELHEFADKIGMKRSWFQDHKRLPHYDLVPIRRAKALEMGAVEYSLRTWFKEKTPARL